MGSSMGVSWAFHGHPMRRPWNAHGRLSKTSKCGILTKEEVSIIGSSFDPLQYSGVRIFSPCMATSATHAAISGAFQRSLLRPQPGAPTGDQRLRVKRRESSGMFDQNHHRVISSCRTSELYHVLRICVLRCCKDGHLQLVQDH